MRATLCLLAGVCFSFSLTLGAPSIKGHSHNDYLRPRPLLDALEAGLTDVEVDIFRVGDELQGQDLRLLAERAHAKGVRLRLWGGPDDPAAWQAQREAGVDRINTDQPTLLGEFLRGAAASPSR